MFCLFQSGLSSISDIIGDIPSSQRYGAGIVGGGLFLVGLAAGWWAYVRRRRTCAADRSCTVTLPSRATPIMLTIGTTLTLTALIWDRIEAPLIKALS